MLVLGPAALVLLGIALDMQRAGDDVFDDGFRHVFMRANVEDEPADEHVERFVDVIDEDLVVPREVNDGRFADVARTAFRHAVHECGIEHGVPALGDRARDTGHFEDERLEQMGDAVEGAFDIAEGASFVPAAEACDEGVDGVVERGLEGDLFAGEVMVEKRTRATNAGGDVGDRELADAFGGADIDDRLKNLFAAHLVRMACLARVAGALCHGLTPSSLNLLHL